MQGCPRFFRWLAVAAVADWLLGRTLSRAAIFMPKSAPVLSTYQAVIGLAQLASTAAALLAYAALLWIAWQMARRSHLAMAVTLTGLVSLSLISLVYAPTAWSTLAVHLLVLFAVLSLARRWRRSRAEGLAWALAAGAVGAGQLFHAAGAIQTGLGLPGPPAAALLFFNLGEALVVAAGIWFGWAFIPRPRAGRLLLLGAIPGLAFIALYRAAPAMAGVLAIWSVGLTLFLPWPLYALSLTGWAAATIGQLTSRKPAGMGLLLLITGGYAPQLSLQLSLIVLALWLLTGGTAGWARSLNAHGISLSNPWRPTAQPEG